MNALTIFPSTPEPPTIPLWQDGAPPHLAASVVDVDRRVCRALRCEQCGRRRLEFKPQHSGQRYRVLAHCHGCDHDTEL